MKDVQDIFDQVQELKKEQKDIRKEYKDALYNTEGYEDLLEELKKTRDKKKQMEVQVQESMGSRYDEMEKNKGDINELSQMISDVAMSSIAEGKNINVTDKYNNLYEPVYKVSFKKAS